MFSLLTALGADAPDRHAVESTNEVLLGENVVTSTGTGERSLHATERARSNQARMRLDGLAANPRACALYGGLGCHVRFRKGLFSCYEKRLDAEEREQ